MPSRRRAARRPGARGSDGGRARAESCATPRAAASKRRQTIEAFHHSPIRGEPRTGRRGRERFPRQQSLPSPSLFHEPLDDVAGGPFDRPLRLVHEGVELFSPSPYGRRQLIPLTTTRFLDAETGAEIAFETEAGQVTRAVVYVGGIELMNYERLP